jgi:hypothetical protein
MKLSALLEGLEVLKTTADPEQEITGVSYDSRATAPGDLFVAIRAGYAADGHRLYSRGRGGGRRRCALCQRAAGGRHPRMCRSSRQGRRWPPSPPTGSAVRPTT